MADGYVRPLDENDLYDIPTHMSTKFVTDRLERTFQRNVAAGYKHPLAFAVVQANWKRVVVGVTLFTFEMLFGVAMSATLSFILNGFEEKRDSAYATAS